MTLVRKMDGNIEEFDVSKLKKSLKAAGAGEDAVKQISEHISEEISKLALVDTQQIYAHAFEILKHFEKKPVAARYSLKRAIFDLGPSGFPFERFVAEIFKSLGYSNVKSGTYFDGRCAPHEIDLYAEKNGKIMGAELKFHNTPGFKTDLKVALYVEARFKDLLKAKKPISEGWLITNTSFTKNVIKYAKCSGLKLLSWDYPEDASLIRFIEDSKIHPITALTELNSAQKRALLEKNIVTCKQALRLISEKGSLDISLSQESKQNVLEELESLCSS